MKIRKYFLENQTLKKCNLPIIDAILQSDSSKVAIGVWPHQDGEEIIALKSRLTIDLKGKELYFFNSESHPLASGDLNVRDENA